MAECPTCNGLKIVEIVERTGEARAIVPGSASSPGQVVIPCPACMATTGSEMDRVQPVPPSDGERPAARITRTI
jgi:hypothetical protein